MRTVRQNRDSYEPNLRGLGKYIADRHDLSDQVAFKICADVFAFVRDCALGGITFIIARFGTFSRRLVKERFNVPFGNGVDPQWVLKFKRSRGYGAKGLDVDDAGTDDTGESEPDEQEQE